MKVAFYTALIWSLSLTVFSQDIWTRYNLPKNGAVEHVVVTPEGDIFAQISFIGMYRSTNEGMLWESIDFPISIFDDFICDNTGVLYIFDGAGPGNLYRSLNKGVTWDKIYPINSGKKLAFDSNYRMFALTNGHGIVYSDDSGKTMVEASNHLLADLVVTNDDIVFGYSTQQLLRSTDRGETWEDIFPNLGDISGLWAMTSDPVGNIYAGISHGIGTQRKYYVYRSTDLGETWIDTQFRTPVTGQLSSNAPGIVIVTSTLNMPRRTTDYGVTWHPYSAGHEAHNFVYDLAFTPDGRAVTGSGGCIYITNNPVGTENIAQLPTTVTLAQSYPNPVSTNQSAYINFELPTEEYITLTVYNTTGQQVATVAQGTYQPGTHIAQFTPSDLPAGVYLYRLAAGDRVQSRLLQIIK